MSNRENWYPPNVIVTSEGFIQGRSVLTTHTFPHSLYGTNVLGTDCEQTEAFHFQDEDHPRKIRRLRNSGSYIPRPCEVCGNKASGKHYSVYSCEGCKGFFRRFVRTGKKFECFKGSLGECDVNGVKRRSCRGCRLVKCLNAGMKVNGGRLSRTTQQSPLTLSHQIPSVSSPDLPESPMSYCSQMSTPEPTESQLSSRFTTPFLVPLPENICYSSHPTFNAQSATSWEFETPVQLNQKFDHFLANDIPLSFPTIPQETANEPKQFEWSEILNQCLI